MRKTLIVLEDDASLRRTIEREARRNGAGYRCEMLATFAQGTAFLSRLAPNDASIGGMLVDVGLGDGSGLELLARARQLLPEVPAVVMTGLAVGADANALGAAWIQKPFAPIARIFVALEAQRARSALSVPDAVVLLAEAARLRVVEERLVASIAEGATSGDLHERLGLKRETCKTRLRRMGKRTGLREVEQIKTIVLLLARRGAAGLDEVARHGVVLPTSSE